LPDAPGIYLILDGDECLYVGQSRNLRQRWKVHHRLRQIRQLSADLVIAWLIAAPSELRTIERLLIEQLQPRLNRAPQVDKHGVFYLRLDDELLGRIGRYAEKLAAKQPGFKPTRSDAIRILLHKALDAEEEP
jgi:excinuclease UvrABC nuclease subunit